MKKQLQLVYKKIVSYAIYKPCSQKQSLTKIKIRVSVIWNFLLLQ